MDDLATLQTQLNALRAARATGVRKCKVGERETEFKSDAEMATAIGDLVRRITTLQGKPSITTVLIASTKGLST